MKDISHRNGLSICTGNVIFFHPQKNLQLVTVLESVFRFKEGDYAETDI